MKNVQLDKPLPDVFLFYIDGRLKSLEDTIKKDIPMLCGEISENFTLRFKLVSALYVFVVPYSTSFYGYNA